MILLAGGTAITAENHQHKKEENNAFPEHFMVNNKDTGNEDVYAKPISPKPSIKIPPAPPPRAIPPKQRTLKFSNEENSSESIYDNPNSYKTNKASHEDISVQKSSKLPTYDSVVNNENKSKN